ncbi:MAG TPA: multicopper oxidase domain-containing protein [Anaeromyxobacter sp.]|nr:multicopper oxidase domain-containing protein [Anaeromyxobacter sp.]
MTRRDMLKLGLAAGGAVAVGQRVLAQCVDSTPIPLHEYLYPGCNYTPEDMPVSPFIVQPYVDPLPIPKTMRPGWRRPDGTLVEGTGVYRADGIYPDPEAWSVRKSAFSAFPGTPHVVAPGPAPGHQDAFGDRPGNHQLQEPTWGIPNAGTHQLFPKVGGATYADLNAQEKAAFDALADPLLFHIRVNIGEKVFTSSPVVPINSAGQALTPPPGAIQIPAGTVDWFGTQVPAYKTPPSTIYGFNGGFPGALINAEYGRPVIIRFENDLDLNPNCRTRQDFGAPDWAFLTHLHNGHTAPESDGQPHHLLENEGGYQPMEWSDNLYLMYAAGGDEREKQSFLWFHDHRMHHTGPNVYKGMVGLMPHYDPVLDPGDERTGPLKLPGLRTDNGDGSFDVEYDIPLALYDCSLDDGTVLHRDMHQDPAKGLCGVAHPEWWGQLFLQHKVNHGYAFDIFTVNCTAFPVLHVKRRKYRLRFLGASLSRQYRLSFRTGTPMPFPGQQGQWNFGTVSNKGKPVTQSGDLAMDMDQIASEGGLLPNVIKRQEIEIWPANRREVIVDFSRWIDRKPTAIGDVLYLTNTLQMLNGRKETDNRDIGFDQHYAVPLMKIVIDGDAPDASVVPANNQLLRAPTPFDPTAVPAPDRIFDLDRSGTLGGEDEWLINNLGFNPAAPLATPKFGTPEAWGINNGGGGWTHPMHIHQEEHHVIFRSTNLSKHIDDTGKFDVVNLEPSEKTIIYRRFRTFRGNYVAHCHQLAHEDHNMMFGWTIIA